VLDRVGFVGFGEAGYHLAKGLRGAGVTQTFAFDIDRSERVRSRALETETELVESNAALAGECVVIFSAVTASLIVNLSRGDRPVRPVYAAMAPLLARCASPRLTECSMSAGADRLV